MRKFIPYLQLLILCLLISTTAHGVYLAEWFENRFMAGPNDGLAQMLPFKNFLYSQYTAGEFFYSPQFGLGSDTYSSLAYYFSISIVFLLTTVFLFLLESLSLIASPDLLFWAHAAVFISIIRLTLVLMITYFVFRYMKFGRLPAFLGACIYGLSGMYFRHTVYWEFFADAYLWLPLLIFGAEKVLRENRAGWFLFAVALSMFDNFYFAYINFFLTGIYIVFRFFIPLESNEMRRGTAAVKFLVSGLIGAGISAVSFIPSVYAFLNNHRPPYIQEIDWFRTTDNILYTSSYIVLPAVFVLLVFIVPLYRERRFRLFAFLVLFGVLLHFSPKVASLFNGLSAPQYRWEYFLSFAAGGAVAAAFSSLPLLKSRHIAMASPLALFVYGFFAWDDAKLSVSPSTILTALSVTLLVFLLFVWTLRKNSIAGQLAIFGTLFLAVAAVGYFIITPSADFTLEIRALIFLAVIGTVLFTFMLTAWTVRDHSKAGHAAAVIILSLICFVNGYQLHLLVNTGNTRQVSEEYITGPEYNDPEIQNLLNQIADRETDPVYRIDWMEGVRNNTPLVQNFRGLSAYSSILNKELLYFYLYDLEIDMARESVSRYATLGKRANLHSLLQGKYVILPSNNANVPYGFEKVLASENFTVYENQYPLPFVRGTSTVYSEKSLIDEPMLTREHAMLTGVVLEDPENPAPPPAAPKELAYEIHGADGKYADGLLTVTGETGGMDLMLTDKPTVPGDLYVSFHLENKARDEGFNLSVNSYETSRKSNQSVYKTFVDDLTIRIPADDTIRIRMPEGTYELTDLKVYEEPYEVLRAAAADEPAENRVEWNGSRLQAEYENEDGADFLVMPIPYEIGWSAEVNGEKVDVQPANYAFLAIPAAEGLNEITLTYRPPYFYPTLAVTILSLVLGIIYIRRQTSIKRR